MPHAHIPQCQYIRTDGRQCGSPKLKGKRYCYFHYEVHRAVAHLDIPPLEDGNAIQLALTDLARAIVEERIALKPAALLAYILQTASANLKRVHLGVFPDRMITELPDLDPYARGLYPEPGERNRDPELSCHPERGDSSLSRVEGPGRPPAQPREGRIRSAASAPSVQTSSAPSAFQALAPSEDHDSLPPRLRASAVKASAPSAFQALDPSEGNRSLPPRLRASAVKLGQEVGGRRQGQEARRGR